MATINAISRPEVTNSPSLNLFGDCGGCWLVMACFLLDGAGRATPKPRRDAIGFAHLATTARGDQPASPHRPRAGGGPAGNGLVAECASGRRFRGPALRASGSGARAGS